MMTIDTRPITQDIRLRIPEELHSEPIISQLTSQCGVIVNIVSATLGAEAGSGWFHKNNTVSGKLSALALRGKRARQFMAINLSLV